MKKRGSNNKAKDQNYDSVTTATGKIVIRDAVPTSVICKRIRSIIQNKKISNNKISTFISPILPELLIRRSSIDAALVGTIRDLLQSKNYWKTIELHGSIPSTSRILQSAFSSIKSGYSNNNNSNSNNSKKRRTIDHLIIIEPSETTISWLGMLLKDEKLDSTHTSTSWCKHNHYNTNLTSLSLRSTKFSMSTMTCLSDGIGNANCILQSLDLSTSNLNTTNGKVNHHGQIIDIFAVALQSNVYLQKLSLHSCHLEDDEITIIIESLYHHPNLIDLDISINFCQELSTKSLAKLITSPSSTSPTSSVQKRKASSLSSSSSSSSVSSTSSSALLRLNLSMQDVWDDRTYIYYLISALDDKKCVLQHLDLSCNFLNDEHLYALIQTLVPTDTDTDTNTNTKYKTTKTRRRSSSSRYSSTLQSIILKDNSITDEGLMELGKEDVMSQLSSSLTYLDLSNNLYTTDGITALENGMKSNMTLLQLIVDSPSTSLLHTLALNRGGRRYKQVILAPEEEEEEEEMGEDDDDEDVDDNANDDDTNLQRRDQHKHERKRNSAIYTARRRRRRRRQIYVPLSLWPKILSKTRSCLIEEQKSVGITQADILFDLLHGPVLLER